MKVVIELDIDLPVDMPDALVEEWIEFELGLICQREKSQLDGKDLGDITNEYYITIKH